MLPILIIGAQRYGIYQGGMPAKEQHAQTPLKKSSLLFFMVEMCREQKASRLDFSKKHSFAENFQALMKKTFLIAAVAAMAQTASAQFSLAPEVGLQMTDMNGKDASKSAGSDTKMKLGFRGGVNADYGFTENLHVSLGLFYSGMGFKADADNGVGGTTTATFNVNYLQLPLYISYMSGEAGSNRFLAGVGPYLGFAMGGKIKANGESADLKFGSSAEDDLKSTDFGINVSAGYMLSMGLYARLHYGLGLSNNQPKGDKDNSTINSGFGLSVGYNLPL
jgi:hypothetical protein